MLRVSPAPSLQVGTVKPSFISLFPQLKDFVCEQHREEMEKCIQQQSINKNNTPAYDLTFTYFLKQDVLKLVVHKTNGGGYSAWYCIMFAYWSQLKCPRFFFFGLDCHLVDTVSQISMHGLMTVVKPCQIPQPWLSSRGHWGKHPPDCSLMDLLSN